MYTQNNHQLSEPWATIEGWVGPLPSTTWYQVFGSIWLKVTKPERPVYSFSLGYIEEVSLWTQAQFQAHVTWHTLRFEIPFLTPGEKTLSGIGLLGVSLDLYLPQADDLDAAFAVQGLQSPGNMLVPGERFIVYKRVPSLWSDLGWTRRRMKGILYLGPSSLSTPVYTESEHC